MRLLPQRSAVSLRLTDRVLLFFFHPEAQPQDEDIKGTVGSERHSLSALCGGRAAHFAA
jgi:hypothetical protein